MGPEVPPPEPSLPDRYGVRVVDEPIALFRAEYDSLRNESSKALEAQHRILEWSITAFAVIFVAALSAADGAGVVGPSFGDSSPRLQVLLFGLVLPLLILASGLVWLAELYRMERAGAYLRSRERATWPNRDMEDLAGCRLDWEHHPLLWENVIHDHGKVMTNFLGGFVIYAAALAVSLTTFSLEWWTYRLVSTRWLVAGQVVAGLVCLVVIGTITRRFLSNCGELNVRFHHRESFDSSVKDERWGTPAGVASLGSRSVGVLSRLSLKSPRKAASNDHHSGPTSPQGDGFNSD